jgi:arsenate reductase (thioredoxin)
MLRPSYKTLRPSGTVIRCAEGLCLLTPSSPDAHHIAALACRTIPGVSTGVELDPVARLHIDKAVDALVEEFEGVHSRDTIERLMADSLGGLVRDANVDDFVPALAHRFTRERLRALGRPRGGPSGAPEVLFVGLGDTGRGQMGSALLTLRSEGRVAAHSAGSAIGAAVDAAVVEVMAELGVDLAEAYAKPLSPEVLESADVVVTMGRSVGTITVPATARHEDWRVGDPTGAPVAEVRRVRDDIDRRVQALLAELDTGAALDEPDRQS